MTKKGKSEMVSQDGQESSGANHRTGGFLVLFILFKLLGFGGVS